jgi:hypothetical protein
VHLFKWQQAGHVYVPAFIIVSQSGRISNILLCVPAALENGWPVLHDFVDVQSNRTQSRLALLLLKRICPSDSALGQ